MARKRKTPTRLKTKAERERNNEMKKKSYASQHQCTLPTAYSTSGRRVNRKPPEWAQDQEWDG